MTQPQPTELKTCCICGAPFEEWGNNPHPVKKDGECCDHCNDHIVIPARMLRASLCKDH